MDDAPEFNQQSAEEEKRKAEIAKVKAVKFWTEYYTNEKKTGDPWDKENADKRLKAINDDPISFLETIVGNELLMDERIEEAKRGIEETKEISKKYGIETEKEQEAEHVAETMPEPAKP